MFLRNSGSLSNLTLGDRKGSMESDLLVLACTQVRPSVHSKLGAKPGLTRGASLTMARRRADHVTARDTGPPATGRGTVFLPVHHQSYRCGCTDRQKERTEGRRVRAQCVGPKNRTEGPELYETWDITGGPSLGSKFRT